MILSFYNVPETTDACMLCKYLVKTHSVPGTAPDPGDVLGIKDMDMALFHGKDRLVGKQM